MHFKMKQLSNHTRPRWSVRSFHCRADQRDKGPLLSFTRIHSDFNFFVSTIDRFSIERRDYSEHQYNAYFALCVEDYLSKEF